VRLSRTEVLLGTHQPHFRRRKGQGSKAIRFHGMDTTEARWGGYWLEVLTRSARPELPLLCTVPSYLDGN